MSRVVIVGCGNTGVRLARLHLEAGDEVTVTNTRKLENNHRGSGAMRRESENPRNELEQVVLDLDREVAFPGHFDVVHYHVPPPRDGATDPRIGRFLAALAPPSRLIYLSATSVYGDHGGNWVDENTPAQPGSDRGRRRLDAERQVQEYCSRNGVTAVILRVAAIYGTGHQPRSKHNPDAALKPVNRIHVEDLAAIAFAAATKPDAAGIYDCADGAPSMEPVSSYSSESKKIRARRIVRGLGVTLRYPVFVNDPG